MTATAHTIEAVRHTCVQGWRASPTGPAEPYAELLVEFEVKDPGPAHVCGIHYTTDMWKTRHTVSAECILIEGRYEPGGAEKWAARASIEAHVDSFEYVVFCLDHRDPATVRQIANTNDGRLFRAEPEPVAYAPAAQAPRSRYARASAPCTGPSTTGPSTTGPSTTAPSTGGRGAGVRLATATGRRQEAVPPALVTGRLTASIENISYDAVAAYMRILMMRNFATNTWRFTANQRVSAPGCVIASPSQPGDPETDQNYVNSWVRDSALCIAEAARATLPWDRTDLLDDYISFSRLTQQNAKAQNRPGHACFFIDGHLRPWGIQSDGPALRATAVIGLYDKLSDSGRREAKELVDEDLAYLLGAYDQPTVNLWEETYGLHFFTRAVQRRCFALAAARHGDLGLAADPARLRAAAEELGERLGDHWHTRGGRGYYRATVGGSGRGDDVDSSTLMGAVYGDLKASEPRLLATAAMVWDTFRTLYYVNHYDALRNVGPLIGRYPEDEYDGDISERPNIGHPWPLCTALFAEFYYRLVRQLRGDGLVTVDGLTARFFEQVGADLPHGTYGADSPQFATVVAKLSGAGDRMLDAVVFHSDHLELSEQYDRYTGYQKSVRNLTWSYACYLSAVDARGQLAARDLAGPAQPGHRSGPRVIGPALSPAQPALSPAQPAR